MVCGTIGEPVTCLLSTWRCATTPRRRRRPLAPPPHGRLPTARPPHRALVEQQSDSAGLVVIAEGDRRTLLIHRIGQDCVYQRQARDASRAAAGQQSSLQAELVLLLAACCSCQQ